MIYIIYNIYYYLVGNLEHIFIFLYFGLLERINPINSYFLEVLKSPTNILIEIRNCEIQYGFGSVRFWFLRFLIDFFLASEK